eukprot:4108111-Alexandrium_andersonii.AAC.1
MAKLRAAALRAADPCADRSRSPDLLAAALAARHREVVALTRRVLMARRRAALFPGAAERLSE